MLKHFFLLLLLLFYAGTVYASEKDILADIEGSSRSWLDLVDQGQYQLSWKNASTHFQQTKSEADWVKTVDTIRKPLGPKEARYIATAGYAKGLAGFSGGEYVVVQFYTTFKSKGLAMETITLAKEKDNIWRVADYEIK